MNIDFVKNDLIQNFQESKEYREAFVEESVYVTVASQISAIREQRGWSQKQLGRLVGMAQERISILEDLNAETKPTLNTLLRLAAGFDCGLEVRFIPFSHVLNNSFGNGPDALRVLNFEEDMAEIDGHTRLTGLVGSSQALLDSCTEDPWKLVSINSSALLGGRCEDSNSMTKMLPHAAMNKLGKMDDARGGCQ